MKRILSGMRPTGKLHLGHLAGALSQWVEFQDRYECYYEIADLHALTTDYQEPSAIKENIREMLLDFLAFGVDPEKATLFVQSMVPEISELHLLLSMITPLGWLERCPTYKEQLQQLAEREITNYGFLGYPVLQTADIVSVKADGVPVGEDQVSHLELAREIIRRFHHLYGECFPEPQALLTRSAKLLGTDGRKMSKSYGNAIFLADSPEEITRKISTMFTDPKRPYRKDPGHPDTCPAFGIHARYNPEKAPGIKEDCEQARIGCTECKKMLCEVVLEFLSPYRQKREAWRAEPGEVEKVLQRGSERAREVVARVLGEAKMLMGLYGH